MVKVGAAYLMRVMVKLAKNAVIRGANDAAGKLMPTLMLDGVIGMTDDAIDGVFKWYVAARTPEERRSDAEELANLSPAELEAGIAHAAADEVGNATPEVKAQALALATAARRTLHQSLTVMDASGRSILKPGVWLESAADFTELFRAGAERMLAPGDEVGGRYRIERFIAQGGMGEVYLATQTKMNRSVVLKTILPAIAAKSDFRQRFFQEAQLAAKLSHPNIVPVYDADEDAARDLCYLTMQHLGGEPLDQWLRRQPEGIGFVDFAKLAKALCSALNHAHERGVLHFDLKPSNVMVSKDLAEIFVVDFGLAKACGEGVGAAAMVSSIGGTPYYMAPEVLHGQKAGVQADVYSLGVLFYEALTGEQPVAGCDPVSDVRKGVPKALSDAIRGAMRPRLEERTANVTELWNAINLGLEPVRQGLPSRLTSPASTPDPSAVVPPRASVSGSSRVAPPAKEMKALEYEIRRQLNLDKDAVLGPDQFARVESLSFVSEELTDAGVSWLAHPDTGLAALTSLQLQSDGVTDAGVKELARLDTGLKSLTTLLLSGTKLTEVAAKELARSDTGLKALTRLYLSGEEVTDAWVKELSQVDCGLLCLTHLGFMFTSKVTDAGLKELARPNSGLKALNRLSLSGTTVTESGIIELARPDTGLKALTWLDLSTTFGSIQPLTDAGLHEITRPDTGLKHLCTLNLTGTKVTDEGLKKLSRADTGLKALTSLTVSRLRDKRSAFVMLIHILTGFNSTYKQRLSKEGVTEVGIAAVKARWPNITIEC